MLAADLLFDAGFKVFEAADASEALAILRARADVRAVFTDIEIPGDMNGLELASTIRKTWPAVAIVLTSGRVRPHPEALKGVPFFAKPYRPNEIVAQIASLVETNRVLSTRCDNRTNACHDGRAQQTV
jgi:CheY-like chemotaxis protein